MMPLAISSIVSRRSTRCNVDYHTGIHFICQVDVGTEELPRADRPLCRRAFGRRAGRARSLSEVISNGARRNS
jgi:hypothetical protein